MCGEEYPHGEYDKEKAVSLMKSTLNFYSFYRNAHDYVMGEWNGHHCKDGSMGFADFLGFKAVEE